MNTYHIIRCVSLVATLTIGLAPIAWLPALPTQAAPPPSGELAPSVSPEGIGSITPGAAEDRLKACLARIPKDASIGQRILAGTSCERDEMDRKSIPAVPGAEYASR
jgi:hypothetical protein